MRTPTTTTTLFVVALALYAATVSAQDVNVGAARPKHGNATAAAAAAAAAAATTAAAEEPAAKQPAAIPALSLNVEGIGSMECPPQAEPADVVLKFSIAASEAGIAMNLESMNQMLKYFCDRRPCRRGLVGPIELELPGIGKAVCRPWEDPATVTENIARAAASAGINLGIEDLVKIMQFFCQRKQCFRKIAPPVVLDVEGVGRATVRTWEDPADVVESFARAAIQAGVNFPDQGMVQMLEYFCARRPCKRTTLNPQNRAPQQVVGATGGGGGAAAPAAPAAGGALADADELDLSSA